MAVRGYFDMCALYAMIVFICWHSYSGTRKVAVPDAIGYCQHQTEERGYWKLEWDTGC